MRILPIACVLASLAATHAVRADSRNPFIPRTWPRTVPPSTVVKGAVCGYGATAFVMPERADAVARVEIVAMRGSGSLDVKIIDQLKGTTGGSLYAYSAGSCRDRLKSGAAVIVMTRNNSLVLGESVLAASDPRVPVLVELLRAASDLERATLASEAVASADEAVSDEAARYLVAMPSVLNELGMRHKRTLFLAAKRRPTRELALVLARLRLRMPLEIYGRLGLRDSVARHIAGILDFESERDPDALADVIARESDPARQLAAFERCDRIRKTTASLDPLRWLAGSITHKPWKPTDLEAWCRGQLPPSTRPPYVRRYPPPPPPPVLVPAPKQSAQDPFSTPRLRAGDDLAPYPTRARKPPQKAPPAKRAAPPASGELVPLPAPCDPFATSHGCKRR